MYNYYEYIIVMYDVVRKLEVFNLNVLQKYIKLHLNIVKSPKYHPEHFFRN